MSDNYSFAKKVFIELNETTNGIPTKLDKEDVTYSIVRSIDDFMSLVVDANDVYNKTFQIPQNKQLIFSEEISANDIPKLNNNLYDENIQLFINNYLPDIRIVTYTTSEEPASLGQHEINETRFKNIKWKYAGYYDDPEYTGYSIIRYTRNINAKIRFKVWGKFFQDIRERAALLKDVIDTNIWFFKYKGLRDITWVSSYEDIMYREDGIQKYKTHEYTIVFSEIKEFREKNLEQIVVQYGLE